MLLFPLFRYRQESKGSARKARGQTTNHRINHEVKQKFLNALYDNTDFMLPFITPFLLPIKKYRLSLRANMRMCQKTVIPRLTRNLLKNIRLL